MAPAGGRRLVISAPPRGRCPPGRGAHPAGRDVPGAWRPGARPARRRCGRGLRPSAGPHPEARPGHGEAGARPLSTAPPSNCRTASTCFPDRADNAALYEWLAAFFATPRPRRSVPPIRCRPTSPVCARAARRRSARLPVACRPARAPRAARAGAPRGHDPGARLPARRRRWRRWSSSCSVATPESGPRAAGRDHGRTAPLDRFRASRGYRPFLPVPLWGEVTEPRRGNSTGRGRRGGRRRGRGRRQAPQGVTPGERPDPARRPAAC